jgi:hypothetical protein
MNLADELVKQLVKELDNIGFRWKVCHCYVPCPYDDNPSLGRLVGVLKTTYNKREKGLPAKEI